MKTAELREKTVQELQETLIALLKEQFNLNMQNASGQLEQSHLIKLARRNVARVRTILNEKKDA